MSARILIVDDEWANVLLHESFLADTATETRSVTDSLEIERVFRKFEPGRTNKEMAVALHEREDGRGEPVAYLRQGERRLPD